MRRRSRNESNRHGVIEKVPSRWRLTLLGGDFLVQKKGFFQFLAIFLLFFCTFRLAWTAGSARVARVARFFKKEPRHFHFYKVLLNTLKKHTSAPQLSDKQTSRILQKTQSTPIPPPAIPKRSHVSKTNESPRMGGYPIQRKPSKQQRIEKYKKRY